MNALWALDLFPVNTEIIISIICLYIFVIQCLLALQELVVCYGSHSVYVLFLSLLRSICNSVSCTSTAAICIRPVTEWLICVKP